MHSSQTAPPSYFHSVPSRVAQVAHFLEADLQPWAAALGAALFTPFDAATSAEQPPKPRRAAWRAMLHKLVRRARVRGAQARAAASHAQSSQAAARREAWRHLDELAPLGGAADAVLRAWRRPLREQLPLTPPEWVAAVICSHGRGADGRGADGHGRGADGRLTLNDADIAACLTALRALRPRCEPEPRGQRQADAG